MIIDEDLKISEGVGNGAHICENFQSFFFLFPTKIHIGIDVSYKIS